MKIAGREVGLGHPPFVVAEMSGNHNQSFEAALAIVEAAAGSGAHAIKLQTYTADTMTLDVDRDEFRIDDPGSPWNGQSLYGLYMQASTPWEWHAPLFRRAKELGLAAFSSPFDESAVDFLESLDAPAYKIASFENTDLPLIARAAATGKPLIISTGMASREEIGEAVGAARGAGCREHLLGKCTSAYPASPTDANVLTIPDMRVRFGCEVGLSDHTLGIGVAVASVALGAALIEKHFTLRRAEGGVDAAFSMEPGEMAQLVAESLHAHQAIGQVAYGATAAEEPNKGFRRSIYVVRNIAAGEAFTAENIRCLRPGKGLAPRHWSALLGRKAAQALAKGTPLSWDLVS
jgi:pseudaminic acid synthase